MKIKDRYKLLNYAKEYYSEKFNLDLEFKHLSKKELYKILKEYKHSSMCEWSYCCYGLYTCCWQDPFEEGCWGLTQASVDRCIKSAIDDTAKICRKDSRILYCKSDNQVHVIIVARDICATDFLIIFTNEVR